MALNSASDITDRIGRPEPMALGSAHVPHPAIILNFVVGYFCAFNLSEHLYGTLALPSPFWLPDSVLLTALLLVPKPQWWLLAIAIWPIRWLSGAAPGTPTWFLIVSTANDMAK